VIDHARQAAYIVGGVTELCRLIHASRSEVYNWRRIPAKRVIKIEELTKGDLTRHEMRPDIYGPRPS
jgi:DNA-binding transcriptional regulator YdaS (Cro superfamily)